MKAKHPPKLNIWAGISARGATKVVVFTRTLTVTRRHLDEVYPDGHRFQQDNDPKHTSRYAQDYIEEKCFNWFKTPASSPDINPTELIWHAVKNMYEMNSNGRTWANLKRV